MILADTITDEQIRELLDAVKTADGDHGARLCALAGAEWLDDIELACTTALNPECGRHYRVARARCAEILNARKAQS